MPINRTRNNSWCGAKSNVSHYKQKVGITGKREGSFRARGYGGHVELFLKEAEGVERGDQNQSRHHINLRKNEELEGIWKTTGGSPLGWIKTGWEKGKRAQGRHYSQGPVSLITKLQETKQKRSRGLLLLYRGGKKKAGCRPPWKRREKSLLLVKTLHKGGKGEKNDTKTAGILGGGTQLPRRGRVFETGGRVERRWSDAPKEGGEMNGGGVPVWGLRFCLGLQKDSRNNASNPAEEGKMYGRF